MIDRATTATVDRAAQDGGPAGIHRARTALAGVAEPTVPRDA
jgi:hypothetical protein